MHVLTYKGEGGGEDEVHLIAVDGECDGEVGDHTGANEELIHSCPVVGVNTHLEISHFYMWGLSCESIYDVYMQVYLYMMFFVYLND